MKITDEDVERATQAVAGALPNQYKHVAGIVARAVLATQPDRYREGFEKAREISAEIVDDEIEMVAPQTVGVIKSIRDAIRNMEMPDE